MGITDVSTRTVRYDCDRCKRNRTSIVSAHEAPDWPPGWRYIKLYNGDGTKALDRTLCDQCATLSCQFLAGEQIAPVGA